MMKNKEGLSKAAAVLSLVAAVLAAYVSVTQQTLWLAGTQWILIAILLAVYAVYLSACTCGTGEQK